MSYSIREPYRKLMSLRDSSDPSNHESLNNLDMLYMLVPVRLIILTCMIWVYVMGKFVDVKESLRPMEIQSLIVAAVLYGSITVIPLFLAHRNPLIVFNRPLFIGIAILEILLLGFAFWATADVESPIVYFVLIPIGTITRMTQIPLLLKIFFFSVIIVIFSSLMQINSSEWDPDRWLANLPSTLIVTCMITILIWRHDRQNRNKLVKSNIKFTMDLLQKSSGAKLSFLRIGRENAGRKMLHLLATTPWDQFRHMISPDVMTFDVKKSSSISGRAYRQGNIETVIGKDHLSKKVFANGVVYQYGLQSGIAMPLPDNLGTISFFWDVDDIPIEKENPQIEHYLKQLTTYLHNEADQIDMWIERSRQQHTLLEDWEQVGTSTQLLLNDSDLLSSSDALSNEMVNVSGSSGACLLLFEEEKKQFEANPDRRGCAGDEYDALLHLEYKPEEIEQFMDNASGSADSNSFYITLDGKDHFAIPLYIDEHENERKWIGLLILILKPEQRIDVPKRRQLEMLGLHAAADLRNCQLHLKSDTALQARDALAEMIQLLFATERVTNVEQDFFKSVGTILKDTLKQIVSYSLGIVDADTHQLKEENWLSTIEAWDAVPVDNLERQAEVDNLIQNENRVVMFNYGHKVSKYHTFALKQGVRRSYGIAFRIDKKRYGVIFTNYGRVDRPDEYQTRQILQLLPEPISQAWRMWHQWYKLIQDEKANQREFWRFELHDQINELQSKVKRPLELFSFKLERAYLPDYAEEAKTIHQSVIGISATLKQFNEDIRDPIYRDKGLFAALKHFTEDERYPNLTVECQGQNEPVPHIAASFYLISREALANAYKHGIEGQTKVHLSLHCYENHNHLQIRDNGSGYAGDKISGSGTDIMRYQAKLIGATIEWIVCDDPQGTSVEVIHDPNNHQNQLWSN